MKKWIFISFTILILFFLLCIFLFQSSLSNQYYYRHMTKSISRDAIELEKDYYKIKGNDVDMHLFVDYTGYSIKSGNNLLLLGEDDEVIFSSYSDNKFADIEYVKKFINRLWKKKFITNDEKSEYIVVTLPYLEEEILITKYKFKEGERLIVVTSVKKIKQAIKIMNQLLIRILVTVSILLVIMIHIIARKVSKSLVSLSDRAKQISNLDFSQVELDERVPCEIKVLGETFNYLALKLDETISDLDDANKKLVKDIDVKKRFISDVSHELKTPVTIIKSHSEAILDDVGDKEYYTEAINEEANRMGHLIEELMDLFRLEADSDMLDKKEISITDLISNTVKRLGILVDKNDKALSIKINIEDDIVMADEKEIDKVLKNLIENAIIYSSKRYIKIEVDGNEEWVYISVINEAIGLTQNHIDNMFDRFYKIDKSRNREKGGSGLGLSIVQTVVRKHGGDAMASLQDNILRISVSLPRK